MTRRLPSLIVAVVVSALAFAAAAHAQRGHPYMRFRLGASAGSQSLLSALGMPAAFSEPGRADSAPEPGVPAGTPTADAETIGTLPRVLVGDTPQDSAFDPATDTVYVANASDNTLSVVDARTCSALDTSGCTQTPPTVAAGNGPFTIAIDDVTHTLYVTDSGSDTVSVIDTATCNARNTTGCGQTPATLTVGDGPNGVAVDAATDTVYVADAGSAFSGSGDAFGDMVSVIDGATCNATDTSGCGQTPTTVTVGSFPFGVTIDPADETLYVTDANDDSVSMIDTATCNALHTSGCRATPATAAVGEFPVGAAVDSRNGTIYVANNNEPSVSMIDGSTCNATNTVGCRAHPDTLSVLGGPDSVAVNPATNTLFVANNGAGNNTGRANIVSVIDAATCNAGNTSGCDRRAPTVLTGANPGGLSVDEKTDTVFAATFDNSLQIIDAAACNAAVSPAAASRHRRRTGETSLSRWRSTKRRTQPTSVTAPSSTASRPGRSRCSTRTPATQSIGRDAIPVRRRSRPNSTHTRSPSTRPPTPSTRPTSKTSTATPATASR
jgi:YVTN family beta-propeller protein